MKPVAIIGGGPAGITAAYDLGKRGIQSHVFESGDQVGGLSRTIQHNGYRFDIGGHRFFSKSERVRALWDEILGEDFLLRPRLSRIRYNDLYFDYPLKPSSALGALGTIEAIRICASYARARMAPAQQETSFEQWVTRRFGRRLYEIFFKTYTEKVWGIPCSEISADWAAQRIRNLSLGEAVRNAIVPGLNRESDDVITTLIDQFHYPRLGPGMMWERCAERVVRAGGTVCTNATVERIRHRAGSVRSVEVARNGASEEIQVDELISTMPLRNLIRALDPAPPEDVRRAAEGLRYRDYLAVVLVVDRAQVFPDNWIYIHSPEVKLGRIQNYKNWSAEMVPDASRTSLGLEYFLWQHDPEWGWPDDRLIAMAIDECRRIGLIESSQVEDAVVVRVPKAYPLYDHSYQDNLLVIRDFLNTLGNLQTIGRNGQHRYNNQDHSMLAGLYAAENVERRACGRAAHRDVWSINADCEYQEGGRPAEEPRASPMRLRPAEMD